MYNLKVSVFFKSVNDNLAERTFQKEVKDVNAEIGDLVQHGMAFMEEQGSTTITIIPPHRIVKITYSVIDQ
jgi:uncharacterized protein (UPF0248 family)